MINYLWLFAVAAGPLLLAVAFGYAILRNRRLTREEKQAQSGAVQELYHEEER